MTTSKRVAQKSHENNQVHDREEKCDTKRESKKKKKTIAKSKNQKNTKM